MATTYRTTTNLSASGVADFAAETHQASGTCAGDSDILVATQAISTSSEEVTTGEILAGSVAMLEIVNLDTTNFVSIGFENPVVAGTKTIKLLAGESALLPRPSAALYAIANTAQVTILKRAVEV